ELLEENRRQARRLGVVHLDAAVGRDLRARRTEDRVDEVGLTGLESRDPGNGLGNHVDPYRVETGDALVVARVRLELDELLDLVARELEGAGGHRLLLEGVFADLRVIGLR